MFFKIIVHILMLQMVTYAENRPFSLVADSVKRATIEKKWTPRKMFPKGSGMKINHQNEFLKPIPRDYEAGTGLKALQNLKLGNKGKLGRIDVI